MGNTILLADKSITIQKIVELTFAEDQFEIKCVNDGQAALDLIPQVNPDIILADISLPVKSGYDVCRTLRTDPEFRSFSEIPVILLAGIYETMDEERAKQVEEKVKEVGANDLLSKPFDPQLLTTKVKDLMIQKSIGTFQSPAAGNMDTFSFDSPAADSNAFADSLYNPQSSVDDTGTFDGPPEPPDDTEKTMILSVPPSFARDIFAQSPPFEKEPENGQPMHEVDLNSVKPVNEQLFDASDLEAESSQGFFDSPSSPEDSPDSLFQSNPEISTSDMQWSDSAYDMISPEVSSEPEQPVHYGDFPEPTSTSFSEPSSIPMVDEPFGDVLQEPSIQGGWDSATVSDEEASPFGFPEPEVPKKVEDFGDQTVAYNPHEEIGSLSHDAADAFMMNEPALDIQEPLAERVLQDTEPESIWHQSEPVEAEPVVNEVSEIPQVASIPEPEDAVELQPDLTEAAMNTEPEPAPVEEKTVETVVDAPAQANQKFEVTEELIDKIVERVIAKMSLPMLSDIVWQVVPDLAEKMIRRELEKLHSDDE